MGNETSGVTSPIESRSPWISMWTRPRATIQSIIDSDPKRSVLLLASLTGISQALDKASLKNAGDDLPFPLILVTSFAGIISGVIGLYIFGFLIKHASAWLGGKADGEKSRAAIAWSNVPIAWGLLLWIPQLALFGNELFSATTPRMDSHPFAVLGFGVIDITIAVWALVLLCKAVGQVNGFSAWRGLGSCLIAAALIIMPILAVAFAISAFK